MSNEYGQGGGYGGGQGGYGGGRGGYGGGRGGYGGGQRGDQGGRHERRGIPLSELDPELTAFSRRVIGAAIEVHKSLGPGYDQGTYLAALRSEMDANGLNYKAGHTLNVEYKGKRVGETVADLFVENRFVVQVIARPGDVSTYDRLGCRAKLKAANVDLGLIINFAERRLKDGLVRVLNIEKINADRGIVGGHEDEGGGGGERSHDFDQG